VIVKITRLPIAGQPAAATLNADAPASCMKMHKMSDLEEGSAEAELGTMTSFLNDCLGGTHVLAGSAFSAFILVDFINVIPFMNGI
jgi:hypothetical protein